jgi:hypothetical protein
MPSKTKAVTEKDREVWTIKREVRDWDDKALTSVEAFLLECPFGHQLVVRARPAGTTKFLGTIICEQCPDFEGEHPKWKLPPELSPPSWDSDED